MRLMKRGKSELVKAEVYKEITPRLYRVIPVEVEEEVEEEVRATPFRACTRP